MILPKLISIDTSVFGNLARDYYCQDIKRCNEAKRVKNYIINSGLIPFFSLHHFQEHLQYKDDELLKKRFSLIREFPVVSWIKSKNNSFFTGSVIDIFGTEIKLILDGVKTKKDIISKTKDGLFRYGTGCELLNNFDDELLLLREFDYFDTQQQKSTDSLVHIMDPSISKIKLSDIKDSDLRTPEEAEKYLTEHRQKIESELAERGDKKLKDINTLSDQYIEAVEKFCSNVNQNSSETLIEKLLSANGLTKANIDKNTTIGDLGDLAAYKIQLDIISKSYNFNSDIVLKFSKSIIPSIDVLTKVGIIIRNEPRAHGSNFPDKYMSVFSLYVDYLIVDKRINECFRQLRNREPDFIPQFNQIIKMSDYCDIEHII